MKPCNIDYCSYFFEGNWCHCCKRHDRRYSNNRLNKYQADILLYRCVKKKNRFVAVVMFLGVFFLGHYAYYKANL